MKRFLAIVCLSATLLVACGNDDDAASDTTVAAETSVAADTTPAETTPAETTPAVVETTPAVVETTPAVVETTPVDTAAATTDTPAAAAEGATYTLKEWSLEGPATLTAGAQTINVVNAGDFPHELLVVKGESFAALPQEANGKVTEDQLPAGALIGEVERFQGNADPLSVTLEAGTYVFFCNLAGGPGDAHGKRGQNLTVTVA